MSTRDAILAREAAKRPQPVEPVKPKRVRALPAPAFVEVAKDYPEAEVVNELDAIGEGDQ